MTFYHHGAVSNDDRRDRASGDAAATEFAEPGLFVSLKWSGRWPCGEVWKGRKVS